MTMRVIDEVDVTDRALDAGWTLPEGWQVLAWTEPDDDLRDPRDKGDCYATDVDEADTQPDARVLPALRELDLQAGRRTSGRDQQRRRQGVRRT